MKVKTKILILLGALIFDFYFSILTGPPLPSLVVVLIFLFLFLDSQHTRQAFAPYGTYFIFILINDFLSPYSFGIVSLSFLISVFVMFALFGIINVDRKIVPGLVFAATGTVLYYFIIYLTKLIYGL